MIWCNPNPNPNPNKRTLGLYGLKCTKLKKKVKFKFMYATMSVFFKSPKFDAAKIKVFTETKRSSVRLRRAARCHGGTVLYSNVMT